MAGAFQSGFNMGSNIGFRRLENERQDKLDARQEVLNQRADQEHARRVSQQGAEDDAFRSYSTLNKDGVVSGATGLSQPSMQMLYGGGTAYGSGPEAIQGATSDSAREINRMAAASPERAAGLPVYNPTAPITARPATELERERAYGAIAESRRDVGQMRASQLSQRGIQRDDETRDFVTRTRSLYENRGKSPEDLQAWASHVQPFTGMVSKYNGLDLDARVNPKTGALESIPYSGNKISEVSLEEAMPYLLQSQRLTSQFGSPDAAIEALNKMTTEQRARVMADTNFRLGVKGKEAESVREVLKGENEARRTRALESNYASDAELNDVRIEQLRERANQDRAYGNLASAYAALPDDQKAGEQGKGLAQSMAVLKARFAGVPGLETKPAATGAASAAALKYEVQNQWADTSKGMRIAGLGEDVIGQARAGFYAERGFAPEAATKDLFLERDPKSGDRRTLQDIESYNRMFPNSAVDPSTVPWAKKLGAAAPRPPEPTKTGLLEDQRYIRSPGRGGYVYTYSPRGMTKAEWARQDAAKK